MEASSVSAPAHIGIIMDGNGRWATKRNLRRTRGHREGIEAAKRVVLEAIRQGVSVLSLYAFSTENWRRAEEEVS
ncbi:MAG TPA: undecaprenyl diphosphate synthase family protein, partial [Tichowtungia sp.]|nr:undecaprenyl diphosphate synthase family protein [Tichowtungia sp.]